MNEQDNPESEVVSEDTETSTDTQESTQEEVSASSEETSQEASSEIVDGTSQEDEWIIPGRFRKGEESKLAESYRNLESEFSRRSNELHQLRTSQVNQRKVDPAERVQRFAEEVKRDPVEAIEKIVDSRTQAVQEKVEQQSFNLEYQRLMQNKEFSDLEPTMVQITNSLSLMLTPEQKRDPQLLHWLFYTARGMKSDETVKNAEKKGAQKGERTALKKTKAMVEGSSGSKGHVKKPFNQLSREEMKAELAKGRLQD